jgi:hypothetical protein
MGREIQSLYAFNRGVVSRLGLARIDVKRLALAAEDQTNWMPRVLGSMSLRAGWGYLGAMLNNSAARFLKFIFATTDTALLELTDSTMRVWISDTLLSRPSVSTTITNGTFATDLTGWNSYDEAGATSSWAAPNYLQLAGSGTSRAIREQHVTVTSVNVEHALRITVARGPVTLRVGSTSGDDDYVSETTLYAGTHSISITPSGDFYVRFFSSRAQVVWVSGCTIESAGVVALPTPWTASDLNNIRYDQSADVVFVACSGRQQRRIERRGTRPNARSWSVALYAPEDGPFALQNTGPTTIAASAITGNITLTASKPLFKKKHIGALFSLTSIGQTTTVSAAAQNTWSSPVRVTGLTANRGVSFTVTGTFSATVIVQRSTDNATWTDVGAPLSWTAPTSTPYNDGLDNQIIYYRIGIKTGGYTSGTAVCTASISQGSIRGICRVTDYTSSTSVGAEVLSDLGGTAATSVWEVGQWSDLAGWPTSVRVHEGRMWWAGLNGVWGSISDAYDSFDETVVGDAGAINRTIGSGPVDTINWILSLKAMVLGAQGVELVVRASSLDEPITPTNFNIKGATTQGSGPVDAIKVDQGGYYLNRAATKVFDLAFDLRAYDYASNDLMELAPELGVPGIVRMDCQRLPDTRLHCVRSDGTALVGVINKSEDVLAWIPVTTNGYIEDVVVLPALSGNLDDQVYYVVRRFINGSTVRYLEKWAQEIDCRGDKPLCLLADSYVTYTGAPSNTISAPHLANQQVVVWADGVDVGTNDSVSPWVQRYTADSSGLVTLGAKYSNIVVGLGYTAKFQSAKLGAQAQFSPLNQQKKIGHVGLILADIHRKGVQFGPSFDYLDDMPEIEAGTNVTDEVRPDYDENLIEFPGTWTTDLRICLQGQAPRPATVLALTPDVALFS